MSISFRKNREKKLVPASTSIIMNMNIIMTMITTMSMNIIMTMSITIVMKMRVVDVGIIITIMSMNMNTSMSMSIIIMMGMKAVDVGTIITIMNMTTITSIIITIMAISMISRDFGSLRRTAMRALRSALLKRMSEKIRKKWYHAWRSPFTHWNSGWMRRTQ